MFEATKLTIFDWKYCIAYSLFVNLVVLQEQKCHDPNAQTRRTKVVTLPIERTQGGRSMMLLLLQKI